MEAFVNTQVAPRNWRQVMQSLICDTQEQQKLAEQLHVMKKWTIKEFPHFLQLSL
jgi:hypothetical protein